MKKTNVKVKMLKVNIINNKNTFPRERMSFHKLKIGSRKKESNRSTVNSNEKVKQKNEELNLNLETKLHSRKANIISMSDDFNHDIFKLKKHEFSTAPKTDRVHKIQRIDSFSSGGESVKGNAQKAYRFSYGNGVENQEYSASQVIEFLNVKQSEKKEGSGLKIVKKNSMGENESYQSEKPPVTESVKSRVHQIKQIAPTEVETKVKQAFEIRKKVIELEEQPLNCEMVVVKKQSTDSILEGSNVSTVSQVAQNTQGKQVKTLKQSQGTSVVKQIPVSQNQLGNETKVVHMIKKESWSSSGSVETRDNKLSSSVLIMRTPEKEKNQISKDVIVMNGSPLSEKSSKSHKISQRKSLVADEQPSIEQRPIKINSITLISSQSTPKPQSQFPILQPSPQTSPTKSKLSYRPINQVQVTIIQQNQHLTQQIQKLRKQRDQLLFINKRYQVQLMQSNCQQYYEREIKRLRNEVETLQGNQQQLKHNNFVLQNKCKELEASQEVNKREIKKLLKQLEVIKIDSTKQKHQLKQKSSSLQFVIKQLQQRNNDLSTKFQDYYKKFNDLQKFYKLKCQQQQNLKKYSLNLQTKLANIQKASIQKLKHYQNGLQIHSSARNQVQNQYREYKRQSECEIESLRQNIKQLNLKRQSQALLISSRIKTLEKHNNTIEAELQVVRLQETVKELQTEITKRSELIRQLNNKIDSMISMKDYQQLRKQLEVVNLHKAQLVQQYEKEIMTLNINIQQLKNNLQQTQKQLSLLQHDQILCQTTKSNHQSKLNDHSLVQKQNFKQILKQQILQSDHLKQQLFNKSQLHFKLKQQYEELKVKHQSLKNELEIIKKKFLSYENNSKIKNDILQQELVNEIDSMKRKITLLEKRFDSKVKENKEKEQFIKDYIIGNNGNPNDSQYLVKELESIFLEKEKIDSLTH